LDPSAAIKAAEGAMQSLAVLYRQCHSIDPQSPACAAIQDLLQATAEVSRFIEQGGVGGEQPPVEPVDPMAGMEEPSAIGAAMPPEEPPVDVAAPAGPGMDDASAALHQTMIGDAARRRKPLAL
jgi:hypothetical protein